MLHTPYYCLLVDDNPLDVELAQRALHQVAAEVVLCVAGDSREALHTLHNWPHGTGPHCLLLDVNLGGESGIELARHIRTNPQWVNVPVVMLSTSRNERDVRQAYAAGANSYLVKPVAFAQFIDLMRVVLDYWFKHNVTPLA